MFMLEDIEAIGRLTGLTEEQIASHPELEREYMIRLRFFHLDGGSGPLRGQNLIGCLRHVGLEPPQAKRPAAASKPVNWNDVPVVDENGLPTKVIVSKKVQQGRKVDEVRLLGDYLGMFSMGRLAVRFGANPTVEEFSASQVELAPASIPDDVQTDGESFVVTQQDAATFNEAVEAERPADSKPIPALDPADLTGRWKSPQMKHDWTECEGLPVYVDEGGDTLKGMFVDIGPGDGEVTVFFPDADDPTRGRQRVYKEDKVQLEQVV